MPVGRVGESLRYVGEKQRDRSRCPVTRPFGAPGCLHPTTYQLRVGTGLGSLGDARDRVLQGGPDEALSLVYNVLYGV